MFRQIKTALGAIGLIFPITFVLVLAALWAISYDATHSLRYSREAGEVQLLVDRGLLQIDFVQGDTTDRGFEWEAHRRSASWGRTSLKTFKPDAGPGRLLADLGFGGWAYGIFGRGLEGRVLFVPFWFVILFPGIVFVWQVRTGAFTKERNAVNADHPEETYLRKLIGQASSIQPPSVCPPEIA